MFEESKVPSGHDRPPLTCTCSVRTVMEEVGRSPTFTTRLSDKPCPSQDRSCWMMGKTCRTNIGGDHSQRQNQCFKWGKIKSYILPILLLVLMFSSIPQASANEIRTQLTFPHLEESGANFLIGNISSEALFVVKYTWTEIASLIFSIQGSAGSNHALFYITNPYGILKTAQSIDRDAICEQRETCDITFNIITQPLFEIIRVTISVSDRNDNAPIFPEDVITISIPETTSPGPVYSLPMAEDQDSQMYSVQRYEIQPIEPPTDTFALQATENDGYISHLSLQLMTPLDRERQQFYRMQVIAYDGGSPALSGTVWVEITVSDANDNNPTFERTEYEVSLQEDTPANTVITTVTAYDPDEGNSGRVTYSWATSTDEDFGHLFGIRSTNGDIYLKQALDYEAGSLYQLSVIAQDNGPDSLPSYAKVTVHVLDINDHTPTITVNSMSETGHAEVMENLRIGSFVTHVIISDPDAGENGNVQCYIDNDNFYISYINQDMLTILTNQMFDREVLDSYFMTLTCRDNGNPPRQSFQDIPVTILDDNDHNPVFVQDTYLVTIHENNLLGASITQVTALDEDIGRNAAITYHLLNDTYFDVLHVDASSGSITAKVAFDYEEEHEYEVLVIGHDDGDYMPRSATTTLHISVLDTNDNVPHFLNNTYTFTARENDTVGTSLGHIEAIDVDTEPYRQIYYIWDPAVIDPIPFSLNPQTGEVTIRSELNREIQEMYSLVAMATNSGYQDMNSLVSVVILVADINDNAPVITYPSAYNNSLQVFVGTEVNTVIARVSAFDLDAGRNGQLRYAMSAVNDSFQIDPTTGKISVTHDLHELAEDLLKLHIEVRDSGDPQLSSVADLNIVIQNTLVSTQARESGTNFFSGPNFIIIMAIIAFTIVVVMIICILLTLRRKHTKERNKKTQYPLRAAVETESGDNSDSSQNLDEDFDEKPFDDGTTPNGHVGGNGERPKKEVKFVMDLGRITESSTDDYHVLWPSRMAKLDEQGGRTRPYDKASPVRGQTPAPLPESGRDPAWGKNWAYEPYSNSPTKKHGGRSHGPGRHSPTTPLTEMELEMHEMLHMLGQEDSETGSVTDSGRGPSEEGDARPSPVDPSAIDERGEGHHRMGIPKLSSVPRAPAPSPACKTYCYHDHRNPSGNHLNCPLKPNRQLDPRVQTSLSKLRPPRTTNVGNVSADSSDSAVSGLSWQAPSSLDSQGSQRGFPSSNDRKVTFKDDRTGRSYTLPQTVPERPSRGPLARLSYGGSGSQVQPTLTAPYATMSYAANDNSADTTYQPVPGVLQVPGYSSTPNDSGLSDEEQSNGNQGNKLKGILKNADEPILRCIQENLEHYEDDPPSWVRDQEGTDVMSDDGTATTTSGSYVLEALDGKRDGRQISPRHGFSV